LVNRDDLVRLSRGQVALKDGTVTLSGRYLMSKGLAMPWSFPGTLWVLEGRRV
jgi:alpha-galactosidase